MKDGAILCNTGHFNVEIDIPALRSLAVETREARQFVEEFTLADGRRLYLLADGRLVNISAAEGHPAIVMDMSFANQALSTEYAVQHAAHAREEGLSGAARDRRGDRPAQARARWASRSTRSPRSRRSTWPRGTKAPESRARGARGGGRPGRARGRRRAAGGRPRRGWPTGASLARVDRATSAGTSAGRVRRARPRARAVRRRLRRPRARSSGTSTSGTRRSSPSSASSAATMGTWSGTSLVRRGSTLTVDVVPRPPAPGTVDLPGALPDLPAPRRAALGTRLPFPTGVVVDACSSRSGSCAWRTTASSSSTSACCRSRRSTSSAARRPRSPTRSGRWSCAARRRSGSRPPTGYALAAARGEDLDAAERVLRESRPTAVNLGWALDEMRGDPSAEHARAIHARRGRALPAHGRARGRAAPAGHARAHALQRRRARDRRLRQRGRRAARRLGARPARARLGRRDAAAAPGRAAHRVGARDGRDPAHGDRRLGGGLADGGRARSTRSSPAPTGSRRTATPRTRSARTGSRCRRGTTASRSTSSRRARPSTSRPRAATRSRSRSATRPR